MQFNQQYYILANYNNTQFHAFDSYLTNIISNAMKFEDEDTAYEHIDRYKTARSHLISMRPVRLNISYTIG